MLKTAKVVGLNSDTAAALAQISPWFVPEQASSGQRLFLTVVCCECEDAFSKVRQALYLAEEKAISETEPASERLPKILTDIKEFLKGADKLAVVLVAVVEDEEGTALYLLSEGEGLIAELFREGKENNLSSLGEGQVVSGILKEGDRIVLATESLQNFFTGDMLSLSKVPLESFEDEVESFLPEAQTNPLAVIVLEKEQPAGETDKVVEVPTLKEASKEEKNRPQLQLASIFRFFPRSRKSVLVLLAILAVVIAVFGGITYQKNQEAQVLANLTQNLDKSKEALSKSNTLKDSDPQAALASLEEAKKFVIAALTIKPDHAEALALKDQIEKGVPNILKAETIDNFPAWLDLGLIKADLSAKRLSLSAGKVLVLDESKQVLVSVDIKTKAHEILAGEEKIGEAKIASLNGDAAWVYSEDKGILRFEGGKVVVVSKTDKEWGEVLDVYGFSGNLYLLDIGKNQIWKYMPIASGFSDKKEYLKEGVKVDFSGAKRMQIESSIYILKSGGEILRFTQGSSDFFAYSGLDKPVKDAKSFFVSSETDNLYLLDGENNRLLVLDKKGVYKGQYQSSRFGGFSDLVVDEDGKKVYLLEGSKIYSMELK